MNDDTSSDRSFIKHLNEKITNHLSDDQFGVEILARELGLSKSQLHRKLQLHTGKSASRLIREARLEKGNELLEKGELSVSEIAYLVGFNSPTYFNTSFHEFYGLTPGEVRQRVKFDPAYSKSSSHEKRKKQESIKTGRNFQRKLILISTVISLLLLTSYIAWSIFQKNRIRWATYQALPEIERLLKEPRYTESYNLALKAEKYIPENPELKDLFIQMSSYISIYTDPTGAEIYIKEYNDIEGDWELIGNSPINNIRLPINFYRWKILKKGYEPVVAVLNPREDTLYRKLDKSGSLPPGMVRVIGSMSENGEIPDFFIDQYEVTNKHYKLFLDDRGYQNKAYWKHIIVKDGIEITWEEAMKLLRDETGRPGPASWRAGDYPEGEDDFPVSGISWYEAAAYAEYAGKVLPTLDHWNLAAGFNIRSNRTFLSEIISVSNFKRTGIVSTGSQHGINCYGAHDMAGNVSEWCWNETEVGRVIKGGAWNDKEYIYLNGSQLPPLTRSSKYGFRCAKYIDRSNIPEALFQPVKDEVFRDYYTEIPVSDEVFEAFKRNFSYEKTTLDPKIEFVDEHFNDYRIEKVSYNTSYGNERIACMLYLPKNTTPPYQTVVYFPHMGAVKIGSINNDTQFHRQLRFLVKNGRALIYPVYYGTWERCDTLTYKTIWGEFSYGYKDIVEKIIKDFSRSIDYLETREDIDTSKIAYLGVSWGARLGLIIPAVEDRIKVSILSLGGLRSKQREIRIPEIDPINYITRITTPMLMLNGRYDHRNPYEISIKPAYDLLGTPMQKKRLRVYETDHSMLQNEFIKESLDWLDEHLGSVEKQIVIEPK